MYARYVVGSGTQAIGVSRDIERQVFKQVDPPYEELFDAVEDHALRCLLEPWKHLRNKESISYEVVKTYKIVLCTSSLIPTREKRLVGFSQQGAGKGRERCLFIYSFMYFCPRVWVRT